MFGHAYLNAMRRGHVSGVVMPAFLSLHTILLDGQEVDTYGRLVFLGRGPKCNDEDI